MIFDAKGITISDSGPVVHFGNSLMPACLSDRLATIVFVLRVKLDSPKLHSH